MRVEQVRAEVEESFTWRQDELRFLRNLVETIKDQEDKRRYRKTLVVMLYSHFEGFWKDAFLIYLKAINDERLPTGQADYAIAAANISDILGALADHDAKSSLLWKHKPADRKLRTRARQQEFIKRLEEIMSRPIVIPETLVDTESNLTPNVMRKNLFALGFQYDRFKSQEGTIHNLVRRRNDVAHGSRTSGFEAEEYSELEGIVFEVMNEITVVIFDAIRRRQYLRHDGETNGDCLDPQSK